jgi:hypothetical protein
MKTFANVSRFQVFVPEKQGWLKYSQSWSERDTWICNFEHQNGSVLCKTVLLSPQQTETIWNRFASADTCETTYYDNGGVWI